MSPGHGLGNLAAVSRKPRRESRDMGRALISSNFTQAVLLQKALVITSTACYHARFLMWKQAKSEALHS